MRQREAAARQQGASEETIQADVLAPKDDDPQPLSEEEIAGGCAVMVAGLLGFPVLVQQQGFSTSARPQRTGPTSHFSEPPGGARRCSRASATVST